MNINNRLVKYILETKTNINFKDSKTLVHGPNIKSRKIVESGIILQHVSMF